MRASIIIRTFNAEATIADALASALAQTLPSGDFAVVVVDDGSSDGTRDVIAGARDCANVRLVAQEHAGAVVAANRGLQEARGEFVAFLDGDDRLEPDFLPVLLAALDAQPDAQFATCDYWEEKDGQRHRVSPASPYGGLLGSMLFRRTALTEAGGFRDFVFAEYELLLRTLGVWRSVHVSTPLFTYVRRGGSISSNGATTARGLDQLRHAHPEHRAVIGGIRRYD